MLGCDDGDGEDDDDDGDVDADDNGAAAADEDDVCFSLALMIGCMLVVLGRSTRRLPRPLATSPHGAMSNSQVSVSCVSCVSVMVCVRVCDDAMVRAMFDVMCDGV